MIKAYRLQHLILLLIGKKYLINQRDRVHKFLKDLSITLLLDIRIFRILINNNVRTLNHIIFPQISNNANSRQIIKIMIKIVLMGIAIVRTCKALISKKTEILTRNKIFKDYLRKSTKIRKI